jgi:serine/threonine protein kinase
MPLILKLVAKTLHAYRVPLNPEPQGQKPACLDKVTLPSARKMIDDCISFDPDIRPTAKELLDYDFFREDLSNAVIIGSRPPRYRHIHVGGLVVI